MSSLSRKAVRVVLVAVVVYYGLRMFDDDTLDRDQLRGKNVLVTGASSGIGEQMAYWYARYGANVFITARREQLLQKVVAECKVLGGPSAKVGYTAADMGSDADRERVIREAQEYFGDIDQLILNHAEQSPVHKWDGSKDQIDILKRIINVNFVSFVHLTGLALPSLKTTNGSIGVVGSFAGRFSAPYMFEYVSSKFALDGFFSGLRHEFKATKQNVSITYATLGVVVTDAAMDVMRKLVPLSRILEKVESHVHYMFASARDTAHVIISATTRRSPELYYPSTQFLWPLTVMRSMFPTLFEYFSMF